MRTGAIFARGSCRALKWMALVGVVFALGVGSAIAQTPPGPQDFKASPVDVDGNPDSGATGAIKLTWKRSVASQTLTGYRWRSQGISAGAWQDITDPETEEVTTDQLTAGALYVFELQAQHADDDDDDTDPEYSNSVIAQVWAIGRPAAVTGLERELHDRAVVLTWEDLNAGDNSRPSRWYQYRYGRDANTDGSLDDSEAGSWSRRAPGMTARVTPLVNGDPYVFEVRAGNEAGVSTSVAIAGTPATVPSMPQDLSANPGTRQVTLSWNRPSSSGGSTILRYEYRYRQEDMPWSTWTTVALATEVVVDSLEPHRSHVFQVRGVNDRGNGDYAEATATPTGPARVPDKPRNLEAAAGDGQVTLRWRAPLSNGGSAIIGYWYQVNGGELEPAGSDLTETVRGLTNGQSYTFAVLARNNEGDGPAESTTATPNPQPPGMPQGLTARAGDGQVTLSWTAPATGGTPTGYQARSGVDGRWSDWAPTSSMTGHTVTGLTNGTEYTFEVQAVNDADSGPSASATATPMAAPVRPGTPQNLTAKAGNEQVTLSWTEPATGGDPTGYQYRVTGAGVEGQWMVTDSATTHTVMDLANGTEYTFEVQAWNSAGASAEPASVKATPMAPDPGPQVTVKSVSTDTSVMESGGLTVSVTMNVPAGTKGADDKVAPIASKMVYVTFPINGDGILARDAAEAGDTTLVGSDFAGGYTWTDIARTEKASEVKRTFRVAIGQDLDAEDEKFQVSVQIDDDPKRSKVITIDDAEEQKFKLTLSSDEKAKNTIKEGGSGTLKLEADPDKTVDLPITLVLDPNDPAKYSLGTTSGTLAAGGSVPSTVSAEADGDREDDTITVMAYASGTLGNDVKLTELEITVSDVNALPAVMATIVDDKGKALDPQPESVMEGETVKVMLTVVDKDGKAMEAAEELSVSLMPSSGDSQDYRLSSHPIVIESGEESSASVDLMIAADDDLGMEMLVFDASVSGDAKIGTGKRAVNGVLSLAIEDGTQALVSAKSQEEVEAAVYAAKEAGMGDDMTFNPGEMIEVMGGDLFTAADGATVTYTAESDMSAVAAASVSGGMVMVTAAGEGMAHITITAHASMPSGVKILDQTDPRMASIVFPVEVGLEALSIMLSGPEDMNLAEGMSAMVTATANRAVTEDTMVMLMRDRAMSSASDDDFMAEAITIEAGEMMGTTMVMAVEDNMMEDMEELVLYGMTEGMAGEVTGEVHLHLWDAAVPALPIIAQLLLAAFLAVGGYRRYRRR